MSGRPSNESRKLALLMGEKTYKGAVHEKCGTDERYVSGSGCVHCARIIATEQREARKKLKAMKATEGHGEYGGEGTIGSAASIEDAPVADPAATYDQSINDLL